MSDIENVLGFRPCSSVALRVQRPTRPCAIIRVDLPPDDDPAVAELGRAVTGLLARVPGADVVELVAYGPPLPPTPLGRADGDVAARLRAVVDGVERALGRAGFFHGRSLIVSGDRWAPARRGATVDAGWRRLPPVGSSGSGRRPDPHRGPFVPIPPASERRRTRALAALADLQRPGAGREPDAIDLLLRWQSVLALSAPPPSDARCIALAWSLRHKAVRDCVLMQCAWGLDAGLLALSDLVASTPTAAFSPETTHGEDLNDGRGSTLAEDAGQGRVGREGESEDETDSGVATSFLGIGDVAPRPAMLRKSIDVLRGIAEVAPETLRPAPLTMLAWLEWSRGRGAAAAGYLDAALAVDPGYLLARLFQHLLSGGATPLWLDPSER